MPLLPFSSQLIADVGISLGDEGKGRLIPEVADELRGTAAAGLASFGGGLLYVPVDWVTPADVGVEGLTSIYVSMGITSHQHIGAKK